jgi:hypothetical protein
MEAKRRALDEIATRQKAADANREREAERVGRAPMLPQIEAVQ